MKYILKSIKIIDPSSPYNEKIMDIELLDGQIKDIAPNINTPKDYIEITGNELCISKGWVDIHAQSGEPLNKTAESLDSFALSAMKGGFTHVVHFPCEDSPAETKSEISFIKNYDNTSPVTILPVGSVSQKNAPKQLAEMLEMKQAGAIAYTNGNEKNIKADILLNALNYAKAFGGKLMIHPEKTELSINGQVNQGLNSVLTGYKGIPKEAEFLAVREILDIAKYCNHEVLVLNITTSESIEAIKEAKKKGQKVWAAVSSMHLLFDDKAILDYNSNYKVNPPLRSESERKKIKKAVSEGIIDIIFSQHIPKVVEEKNLEFDLASFGVVNLQTSFLASLKAFGKENIQIIIKAFSENPSLYLDIKMPTIDKNVAGSFTIFDLGKNTIYTETMHASKSKNTPFFNTEFQGNVLGIVSKGQTVFF